MTQLNPVLDRFYLASLDYSGMKFEDNIIKNKSDKLGDITINDKCLTLPYFNNLKNPDGKIFFHLLNENYTNPENIVFDFYKKRLVLELNLKLSYIIVNLISVGADVQMQQKIKSSKLIEMISNIGEVDHVLTENFLTLVKTSKKINNEAFLFDIFLKKNGEIDDTPYIAIGKINFILANEISKSLEDKDRDYKVFGCKLRKKDLLALNNIFNIIFPDFSNKTKYSEGTDNKIFRYFNILLKTSYMIADRINELCDILEELREPTLNLDECRSNLEWTKYLEELYTMSTEIRLIPNQTDMHLESHKLKIDESKASITQPVTNTQEFNPSNIPVQQVQHPVAMQAPMQTVQQPVQLSPEDIIKGNISPNMMPMVNPGMMMQPNMMQSGMMPMMQPPIPSYIPNWVMQDAMRNNSNMVPMQNMQPNMMPMMQQPMMMNPNMTHMQQPMMMNPNMTHMQPTSGLGFNPLFAGRSNFG